MAKNVRAEEAIAIEIFILQEQICPSPPPLAFVAAQILQCLEFVTQLMKYGCSVTLPEVPDTKRVDSLLDLRMFKCPNLTCATHAFLVRDWCDIGPKVMCRHCVGEDSPSHVTLRNTWLCLVELKDKRHKNRSQVTVYCWTVKLSSVKTKWVLQPL